MFESIIKSQKSDLNCTSKLDKNYRTAFNTSSQFYSHRIFRKAECAMSSETHQNTIFITVRIAKRQTIC